MNRKKINEMRRNKGKIKDTQCTRLEVFAFSLSHFFLLAKNPLGNATIKND